MRFKNKNPFKSECIKYITNQAERFNLSVRFALATAWLESCFTQ